MVREDACFVKNIKQRTNVLFHDMQLSLNSVKGLA
jgi:hypothetical protein